MASVCIHLDNSIKDLVLCLVHINGFENPLVMHFVRSMHEQTKNNKQCDKGALYVLVLITKSSWAEMSQIK